jgi:deazaflavin-dependent oxidoreductase (nitroreductase family)
MSTNPSPPERAGRPGLMYRLMRKMNPLMVRSYARGIGPARITLLLTTTGRKSGLPRVTPLQYEEIDGWFYVAAGRGMRSDWIRNLLANPQAEVQVRQRHFHAAAEVVSDPARIADFLAVRFQRNFFIRLVTHLEGLPLRYTRADLERFASHKTMVVLHPLEKERNIISS